MMFDIENSGTIVPTNFTCYKQVAAYYEEICDELVEYDLKHFHTFVSLCEEDKATPEQVKEAFMQIC